LYLLNAKCLVVFINLLVTLDAIFKNKSGEHIIYDWKSSSGIRDSMLVQIYLYKICVKEELNIDVKKGIIVNCTKQGKLNIKEFVVGTEHGRSGDCLFKNVSLPKQKGVNNERTRSNKIRLR